MSVAPVLVQEEPMTHLVVLVLIQIWTLSWLLLSVSHFRRPMLPRLKTSLSLLLPREEVQLMLELEVLLQFSQV